MKNLFFCYGFLIIYCIKIFERHFKEANKYLIFSCATSPYVETLLKERMSYLLQV